MIIRDVEGGPDPQIFSPLSCLILFIHICGNIVKIGL